MMLLLLAFTEKPLDEGFFVSRTHNITPADVQAEALRKAGLHREAAALTRGNGTVVDNEIVKKAGQLKDQIYIQHKKPFSPPTSSNKPLWLSSDGLLTSSSLDEKYHDVVKDPRSDTLFAAVITQDSVVVYKGVVDWTTPQITWSRWLAWEYPGGGPLADPSIAVTASYVLVGFTKVYSATDFDPRILKINRSTGTTYLYYISTSSNYERSTVITSDYEYWNPSWIYFAYWDDNKDSVMFIRITDPDTTTFTSYGGIAYSFGSTTQIQKLSIDWYYSSYSSSSKLFIAYTDRDTVRLANGSPFGDSWTAPSVTFTRGFFPHIKGYRGGRYLAVVYTYPYSLTDFDCSMRYSTNDGATFNSYNCSASVDDELWPTVAFTVDSVWVSFLRGDKDTPADSLTDTMYVMYAKHSITGSSWIRRDSINDRSYKHLTLTTWHPIIVSSEDTVSSKQFLHVSWARRSGSMSGDFDIRYNYHFLATPTSVSEKIVRGTRSVEIYTTKKGVYIKGNGTYTVYNSTGRAITKGVVKGDKVLALPRGVYMVNFNGKLSTVVVK